MKGSERKIIMIVNVFAQVSFCLGTGTRYASVFRTC